MCFILSLYIYLLINYNFILPWVIFSGNQIFFWDQWCLCIVQNEAGDKWIFKGDTTQKDFCEWLFTPEHAGCTVMAHNFQGYDSYFILQYLRDQGVKYDVIMRGAKALSLKVPMFNISFIDALNFIPMKLANFPKTFGIEELSKDTFPIFSARKKMRISGSHSTYVCITVLMG